MDPKRLPTKIRILRALRLKPMYFIDLQRALRVNPNALNYNLKSLILKGQVERELREGEGRRALYRITMIGRAELRRAQSSLTRERHKG